MFLPILFVFGLALVGLKLGEKFQKQDFRIGHLPYPPQRPKMSAIKTLNRVLASGQEPSDWLVSEATREAYDKGDWNTVNTLSDMFDSPADNASEEQPTPTNDSVETTPVESEPEVQSNTIQQSPLDGIEWEDWKSFADALTTKSADHKTDRHVGKYEQSLSRLKRLGMETPATEEEQDKAFASDMADYWNLEQKLIRDCSGEVVDVHGEKVAITPSGVLGLLKSAGHQGARSWIDNRLDRDKFPRTTDAFLKTNGCF